MKVGFMVIKNGIRLGYPFIEAIASMHRCCDKFLMFDCGSDDNTKETLEHIRSINDKFELHALEWPKHSSSGNAIAVATNNAMQNQTIQQASKVFYLQADEVFHQNSLPYLKDYMGSKNFKSTSFRFLHFRNSFLHYISNPTYDRAIRIITPKGVKSLQDGFNFGGDVNPVYSCNVAVFHLGWCFPYNICQKHINHAKLYPGNGRYEGAKRICQDMLKSGKVSRDRLIKEVDKHYSLTAFQKKDMPKYIDHLYDLDKYNHKLSLDKLQQDLK